MPRTTATLVATVLGDNYVDGFSPDLQAFIDTATLIVTRVLTCAAAKGYTITTDEAEMIERYLAAHYFGHADQFITSKSTNGASGSFQGQTGMGIESSLYGQTAIQLDPSGCLNALTKRQTASATWLGRPSNAQSSAFDRGWTQ